MKTWLLVAVLLSCCPSLEAQTVDDGIMLGRGALQIGNLYSYDSWDQYWEGTLKRANGNIGTITTESNVVTANYGVTDRLNVIGRLPYVWTRSSQGVLHGSQGLQDLTLAAKYSVVDRSARNRGVLRAIAVGSVGIPLTDYNVELLPLSIGDHSRRVSGRGTIFYLTTAGWFVNGSTSYTWRSGVQLDRPYYFTDDTFVMSDEVDMPNALDYVASAGYMKGRLMTAASWSQLRTLGGGDIRRQDMPFVSNRMNFSRLGAMIMAPVPKLRTLRFQVALARTIDGRNVGHATTITGGLLYTFHDAATR
jgi:hypothetical protein